MMTAADNKAAHLIRGPGASSSNPASSLLNRRRNFARGETLACSASPLLGRRSSLTGSQRYTIHTSSGDFVVDVNKDSPTTSPITVFRSRMRRDRSDSTGSTDASSSQAQAHNNSNKKQKIKGMVDTRPTSHRLTADEFDALASKALKSKPFPPQSGMDALDAASLRLRYILHQLHRGDLPLDELKKNIEYAALVLETAYIDESRRLCDEDDDLAEVTPETVPDEVRQWLAATFTRQANPNRPKPKFKSVANAIRTGIMFDRMFRKTSETLVAPISNEISVHLKDISKWDFDVFNLQANSGGHALKYVGYELFNRYGILNRFKIPISCMENFMNQLEAGYSKHNNPYHNLVHAADVTQTTHWMLANTGLVGLLSDLELFAMLFSAMIHDYEHTGHTNNFHVQSGSDFALLYNDRSVLENHHASACFRLLKEADKNLLTGLSREEYREFRNLVVEIVLATDMSTHFMQIKTMKSMLSMPEGIDKVKALCLLVHCCDISHPTKRWQMHSTWTSQVLEEFFRQGDLEASLGLPYSPLCDRHTVHIAESQIGFIDFIVDPTMQVAGDMLNKLVEPLVSIPPSRPGSTLGVPHANDADKSARSRSPLLSPGGTARGGAVTPMQNVPLSADGKLDIPNPWVPLLLENKSIWKKRAAEEEAERKKLEESATVNGTE